MKLSLLAAAAASASAFAPSATRFAARRTALRADVAEDVAQDAVGKGAAEGQAEVVLVGCGAPNRGMGWYHAIQMLEGRCVLKLARRISFFFPTLRHVMCIFCLDGSRCRGSWSERNNWLR